jgi:hypothetical protein
MTAWQVHVMDCEFVDITEVGDGIAFIYRNECPRCASGWVHDSVWLEIHNPGLYWTRPGS